MVNMALSAEEKAEYGPSVMADSPEYPYGLRITLNDEMLEKLGIAIPEAGSVVMLSAKCSVVSVIQTADSDGDGDSDCSVQLQITDMEVSPYKKGVDASKLYGG